MKFLYKPNELTALVFIHGPGGEIQVKKYRHNITDQRQRYQKFCRDMARIWPDAWYINFYWKHSGLFYQRHYLKDQPPFLKN